MRILRVGDIHAQFSNLEETGALMDFVIKVAITKKVNRIELLGDSFHTMAQTRVEVTNFWIDTLPNLANICDTVVLVGNHDMVGHQEGCANALHGINALGIDRLHIVSAPVTFGLFHYLPYVHNNERLIELANEGYDNGARVLVCHGTANGAQYESGMYAPEGFDLNLLKFPLIISGHVHKTQRFGKIIYPGTPRALTASDANEKKGIWIFDHDDVTGAIISEEFISTDSVCTPLIRVQWLEGQECPTFPENAKTTIELVGSSDWIGKTKAKLKGRVSITTKITDKSKPTNRQAGSNLKQFIMDYYTPSTGISKQAVVEYLQELRVL